MDTETKTSSSEQFSTSQMTNHAEASTMAAAVLTRGLRNTRGPAGGCPSHGTRRAKPGGGAKVGEGSGANCANFLEGARL